MAYFGFVTLVWFLLPDYLFVFHSQGELKIEGETEFHLYFLYEDYQQVLFFKSKTKYLAVFLILLRNYLSRPYI